MFDLKKLQDINESVKAVEEIKNNWEDNIVKISIKDVYARKQKKYEFLKANNWKLWPVTPFPEIDEFTKWFKKGWLVWIWAFSNTWKSQLSYYYAQHFVKSWLDVAYFSLEVASEDVLIMVNQYYNWISYQESASQWYNPKLNNLSIYDVWDYYTIDHIEQYVHKFNPDVVFIDFIQIMEFEWTSEYDKLNNWIRRLQRLAIESETTIVYLSQVSNEDAKQEDALNVWLKWSWNLIASSDYVFIMKRQENWDITYWLKKNKHWAAYKKFNLRFDFANWKCECLWEQEKQDEKLKKAFIN